MDALSSLPPLQYLVVYCLPIMWVTIFIGSLTSPHSIASLAKFHTDTSKPLGVWFHMFAVRELVLGLMFLGLIAVDEWRAITIALACAAINGPCDVFLSRKSGATLAEALQAHGVPTVVAYWAVWKLWEEHF
jgi:hypothetical protein